MKALFTGFILLTLLGGCAQEQSKQSSSGDSPLVWQQGGDIEAFWTRYADSKGGLTWGASDKYPAYAGVKEGDTLLIQVAQGPCLMEFFHSRWRRANDVRRWSDEFNRYGGCPNVFD